MRKKAVDTQRKSIEDQLFWVTVLFHFILPNTQKRDCFRSGNIHNIWQQCINSIACLYF